MFCSYLPTLVQEVFLFFPMREPRSGEHESRSGEKEKPLVTLDLNLTFMQTPAVKRVKFIITKRTNGKSAITCLPIKRTNHLICVFVKISTNQSPRVRSWPWRLHESEIQVQGNQRFFFLAASRLVLAASRLSHRKKRKTSGTRVLFTCKTMWRGSRLTFTTLTYVKVCKCGQLVAVERAAISSGFKNIQLFRQELSYTVKHISERENGDWY